MYNKIIKRTLDFLLSLTALIGLSWLFLILILAVLIEDGRPVFFTQKRFGKDRKFFKLYKFRSMRNDAPHDAPTHLLNDPEKYITKVGKFLRKSSLDELPQLINILKGDMSIIGPRPALWNQDDLIEEREKYGANSVRPGLSGLAQIKGRDELSIEEKSRYDGEYVKKLSFMTDIRCIFGTIFSVIRGVGVVEGGIKDK